MKIIIGCEQSQVVTKAFRDTGHECYSCDILPGELNSNWHIQDDILNHLNDGWDLAGFHPDCTYLTNSGVSWLHKDRTRWKKLKDGCSFFNLLKSAPVERIYIENPIPHKYARKEIGDYTQIIQPYQYGHKERKATCLWLKNLPKLKPTDNVYEEMKKLPKNISQRIHWTPPSPDRWKIRSRTFEGIAKAMANQWGTVREDILV